MELTDALMTTEEIRTFVLFLCKVKPPIGAIGGLLRNRGVFPVTTERTCIVVKSGRKGGKRFVNRIYYNRDEVISAFKLKPYPSAKGGPGVKKRPMQIPRYERQKDALQIEKAQIINLELKVGRKFDCEHYCECLDYATIGHIVDAKRVKHNFGCHTCDRYKKKEI